MLKNNPDLSIINKRGLKPIDATNSKAIIDIFQFLNKKKPQTMLKLNLSKKSRPRLLFPDAKKPMMQTADVLFTGVILNKH